MTNKRSTECLHHQRGCGSKIESPQRNHTFVTNVLESLAKPMIYEKERLHLEGIFEVVESNYMNLLFRFANNPNRLVVSPSIIRNSLDNGSKMGHQQMYSIFSRIYTDIVELMKDQRKTIKEIPQERSTRRIILPTSKSKNGRKAQRFGNKKNFMGQFARKGLPMYQDGLFYPNRLP